MDPSEGLPTFEVPEAYVYQIPTTSRAAGHRADEWDVEHWLQAVRCKVVVYHATDAAEVRLETQDTNELFAACPLPKDKSVYTAVDPVLDSSRYFALRVEDPASGRHAFLGLGFRERSAASDFRVALDDYERLKQRAKRAEEARREFEEKLHASGVEDAAGAEAGATTNFGLKEGETISVRLPGAKARPNAGHRDAAPGPAPPPSLAPPPAAKATAPTLAPPPGGFPGWLAPPPETGAAGGAPAAPSPAEEGWANFDDADFGADFGEFQQS